MSTTAPALWSAIYQETLLAHYRAPHNRREMPDATHIGLRKNPLCGDALQLFVRLEADRVQDVAFVGQGCSIAVASASMLTDVLRGRSRSEALALASAVDAMLSTPRHGGVTPDVLTRRSSALDLPEALVALQSVAPFPGRHGCASMPWHALRDALSVQP